MSFPADFAILQRSAGTKTLTSVTSKAKQSKPISNLIETTKKVNTNIMVKSENTKASWNDPKLVAELVSDYDGGNGMTIDALADKFNRTKKSVIGKLVSEGVYVKATVQPKTRADDGPSKKDLLAKLEALGFSEDGLKGLNNATKPALVEVLDRLGANKASEAPAENVA